MIFVPVLCEHTDNFDFHPGLTPASFSSRFDAPVSCKPGLSGNPEHDIIFSMSRGSLGCIVNKNGGY